jgi:hypothetical protein
MPRAVSSEVETTSPFDLDVSQDRHRYEIGLETALEHIPLESIRFERQE